MLSPANRLTKPEDFRSTVRLGRRVGGAVLVVHLAASGDPSTQLTPRAGFVVSKQVGPAVVRNRVKRRLRHLVRERLDSLSPGQSLVVRAQPAAAAASAKDLGLELDRCLERASR